VALGDELVFGFASVDEDDVHVALAAQGERLTSSHGDNVDAATAASLERRQDGGQEAGVSGAGGRREPQHRRRRPGRGGRGGQGDEWERNE